MHVEPADVLPVEARAELRLQLPVPLDGDERYAPARGWMGARGQHCEPVRRRLLGHFVPQQAQLRLGLLRSLDHGRRDLDERLEQLGLDPCRRLAEHAREPVPRRLECLHVDEHQLFLDAERPRRRRTEAAEIHEAPYLPRTPCTGRPAASHA